MRQGLIPLPGQQDLHRAVYQDLPDPESSVGTAGGIMTLILNVPLVLISYKVVGKKFLLKTAVTMLISTFFWILYFPFFHCTADSVCWQQFIQESCWAEEWCCSICGVRPLEESIF